MLRPASYNGDLVGDVTTGSNVRTQKISTAILYSLIAAYNNNLQGIYAYVRGTLKAARSQYARKAPETLFRNTVTHTRECE